MRNYELTYLISTNLSETEVNSAQEKIKSLIEDKGGFFLGANEPVKRKLAYSIKKQVEAYLVSLNFQLSPENLAIFEQELEKEENIIRFIIIVKIISKKAPAILAKKPPKTTKPKKVELEDIEQKLEEILS